MLYCEKCRVHLTGSMKRCPLCQSVLSGEPQEDAYPELPDRKKPYGLIIRLAGLLTVAALVVCIAVNFSFPESGRWSVFVAAGLGSAWILAGVAFWKRRNPMKLIVWQLIVISLLVFAWDRGTGRAGWAVNFVLPILISCMQLAVVITVRCLKLYPSEYLFYLIVCVLAGFGPLALLLCGALQVVYPSVICGGISIVILAALILFRGGSLKDEIERRMHL